MNREKKLSDNITISHSMQSIYNWVSAGIYPRSFPAIIMTKCAALFISLVRTICEGTYWSSGKVARGLLVENIPILFTDIGNVLMHAISGIFRANLEEFKALPLPLNPSLSVCLQIFY